MPDACAVWPITGFLFSGNRFIPESLVPDRWSRVTRTLGTRLTWTAEDWSGQTHAHGTPKEGNRKTTKNATLRNAFNSVCYRVRKKTPMNFPQRLKNVLSCISTLSLILSSHTDLVSCQDNSSCSIHYEMAELCSWLCPSSISSRTVLVYPDWILTPF